MSTDARIGFDRGEFERRVQVLQAGMAGTDLDAMLLTAAPDVTYVTGFLTRFWESPTRPWYVVVPADGGPIAIIPEIGAHLMRATWVDDLRTWDSPRCDAVGLDLLADAIRQVVPQHGCLGLPKGPEHGLRMPLSAFERLCDAIAPRSIGDATGPLRRAREVKSEAELACMRAACSSAAAAFASVPDILREARDLATIARRYQAACLLAGADWISYLATAAGHGGYSDVISPASGQVLGDGDILMLDVGAVCGGYFCDFDRNFGIGSADDASRKAYDALFSATEAGMAAARPGASAADLHRAMSAAIENRGLVPAGGRMGHGVGLSLTEWPSLMPGDETVLREGMVLAIEPALETSPGHIMVHEENVVLRGGGAELLSPRAADVLPVLN